MAEVAVEAERSGPGQQVGGGQGEFELELVLLVGPCRAGCVGRPLSRSGGGPRRGRGTHGVGVLWQGSALRSRQRY